ncbi:MAG: hypothetical protein HOP28_11030 [Gemmatimonadales bacterium]|nr:hypothetical protein [Gemmatimonadales bacterium]
MTPLIMHPAVVPAVAGLLLVLVLALFYRRGRTARWRRRRWAEVPRLADNGLSVGAIARRIGMAQDAIRSVLLADRR